MRTLLFAILFILASLSIQAQTHIQFPATRAELPQLSRIVSIDNYDGTVVSAYANSTELEALQSLGYNYSILTNNSSFGKVVNMATTTEQMRQWNRYPTYDTYVALMQEFQQNYPQICHLDTIGYSIENRLILSLEIHPQQNSNGGAPQFFYSSTMHGDEVTGFYLMLRLIDTLLSGYANNEEIRHLVNTVDIFINPLSNPDGTYAGGNNTVNNSMRYNSRYVDLNRNYPDPFGTSPMYPQQPENTAMINYVSNHHFLLSANLHGGAEVMNYPWDSFESSEREHPNREWWIEVSKRFIDTTRKFSPSHFKDVTNSGYINGGDWYVISNGRQDYMNYYHNCMEITMELSSTKILSSDRLNEYWDFESHSLINYIKEIYALQPVNNINTPSHDTRKFTVYPNPSTETVVIPEELEGRVVEIIDIYGHLISTQVATSRTINIKSLPQGTYLLRSNGRTCKIVKK